MLDARTKTLFAHRLNSLLESSAKSATKIANDLGLSKQALSTWRTGRSMPTRPTMITIANYFSVDVAWLSGCDIPDNTIHDSAPSASKRPTNADILAMREALRKINALNEDGTVDSDTIKKIAALLKDFHSLFRKEGD